MERASKSFSMTFDYPRAICFAVRSCAEISPALEGYCVLRAESPPTWPRVAVSASGSVTRRDQKRR